MSCKIAVCVPSSGICQVHFAQSLATMVNKCSHQTYNDIEDVTFELLLQVGSVIHMNRESLVEAALKMKVDYILFIDDDMAFHPDAFISLLKRRQPIVACNYPMRAFPIKFTALKQDSKTYLETKEISTGLEEVGFVGFGLCLLHTSVFKDLPKPWFLPKYYAAENSYTTEDYPFFEKLREMGHMVFVDHDASKLIGHVGQHMYRWNQFQSETDTNAGGVPHYQWHENKEKEKNAS